MKQILQTSLLTLALALMAGLSGPALACDEMCKEGEIYSDDAEMCIAQQQT